MSEEKDKSKPQSKSRNGSIVGIVIGAGLGMVFGMKNTETRQKMRAQKWLRDILLTCSCHFINTDGAIGPTSQLTVIGAQAF